MFTSGSSHCPFTHTTVRSVGKTTFLYERLSTFLDLLAASVILPCFSSTLHIRFAIINIKGTDEIYQQFRIRASTNEG